MPTQPYHKALSNVISSVDIVPLIIKDFTVSELVFSRLAFYDYLSAEAVHLFNIRARTGINELIPWLVTHQLSRGLFSLYHSLRASELRLVHGVGFEVQDTATLLQNPILFSAHIESCEWDCHSGFIPNGLKWLTNLKILTIRYKKRSAFLRESPNRSTNVPYYYELLSKIDDMEESENEDGQLDTDGVMEEEEITAELNHDGGQENDIDRNLPHAGVLSSDSETSESDEDWNISSDEEVGEPFDDPPIVRFLPSDFLQLSSLRKLEVTHYNFVFPEINVSLFNLEKIYISGNSVIKYLPDWIGRDNKNLETIFVENCPSLEYITKSILQRLESCDVRTIVLKYFQYFCLQASINYNSFLSGQLKKREIKKILQTDEMSDFHRQLLFVKNCPLLPHVLIYIVNMNFPNLKFINPFIEHFSPS